MAFLVSLVLGTLNTFYAALLVSTYWGWFARHVPLVSNYSLEFWQALCLILLLLPFNVMHYKVPTSQEEIDKGGSVEHVVFTAFAKFIMYTVAFAVGYVYNIFING